LPLLYAKKEVFNWLKKGKKTIEVRRGKARRGEIAVFQSGPQTLRFKIVKRESGQLMDVLRQDNFSGVVPSAAELGDAVNFLRRIYGVYDGVFTAYYISPLCDSEKS